MKTDQEILDIVVPAMIVQGEPSITEHGRCTYRGIDGRKCAAGVLISDQEYDPKFELYNSSWLPIPEAKSGLLRGLQMAHDRPAVSSSWPAAAKRGKEWLAEFLLSARELADVYGLTWRAEWVCQ
jgi:hypothetical protein